MGPMDDRPKQKHLEIVRRYNTIPVPARIPGVRDYPGVSRVQFPQVVPLMPQAEECHEERMDHAYAFVWLHAFAVESLWSTAWRMLTLRGCS